MSRWIKVLCSLVLFISISVSADTEEKRAEMLINAAQSIIKDNKYGSLISVDHLGFPQARTVMFSQPNDDFVLWVATKPNTGKVAEIYANPKVKFHFIADDHKSYLSVVGMATLHSDLKTVKENDFFEPKLKAKLWPDFPKDYLLIRIEPIAIEMIGRNIHPDRATWQAQHLCLKPSYHGVCQ